MLTPNEAMVMIRSLHDYIGTCNRSLNANSSPAKTRKVIGEVKTAKALIKKLDAVVDDMVIHV